MDLPVLSLSWRDRPAIRIEQRLRDGDLLDAAQSSGWISIYFLQNKKYQPGKASQ